MFSSFGQMLTTWLMRVDSIRLFVSMDTVSRHVLIFLKMANE